MGLYSVLVGRTQVACPSDAQIRHIHELPAVLPWLWQPGQQPPVTEAAAAAAEEEQGEEEEEERVATLTQIAQKKAAAIKAGGSSSEAERIEAIHVAA
jgi:ribosomal protein L7/L12